tara:strand:- start:73 stop:225 length:153 start_codon:yes stop_codon:yes gene_type:complete
MRFFRPESKRARKQVKQDKAKVTHRSGENRARKAKSQKRSAEKNPAKIKG